LRLKSDLPRYNCHLEIMGNDIREVERNPWECDEVDPNLEDCSEEVAKLPLIAFDPEKHFKKSTTYKQEIRYLLQCQGSPRVVQLLGRTEEVPLFSPSSSDPSWKPFCSIKTKGGSRISGDGCSKSSTVSHTCTLSESYTATLPCVRTACHLRPPMSSLHLSLPTV
jgi:hypothetical protein